MTTQTVEDLLAERARAEPGLSSGFLVSAALHVLVSGLVLVSPFLFPKQVPLIPVIGRAVPLPPGGRGTPDPAPPAGPSGPANAQPPATTPPVTMAPAPPVTAAPAPKVIKPPVDKPQKGLPELSEKARRPKPTPPPASGSSRSTQPAGGRPSSKAPGTTPRAAGSNPQTPGLELAPPGEGVPGGTDPFGDWYLASVQRKIWMLWLQQTKPAGHPPVHVVFTIMADGSVTDVQVVQGSGSFALDTAAKRAVLTAQPFSPLPRHYGTNRKTIQAIFRPT